MHCPMDVLSQFPVRKSRRQKSAFIDAVLAYGKRLGYSATIEKGALGVRNIVFGDPITARYLITAHYDTCARLPFPNLLTPCNLGLFVAWQLLLLVILCVPAGILAGTLGVVFDSPEAAVLISYVFLLAELTLMLVGPANPSNANDNTSGVVTVLETARSLPLELRDRVCFVLFDMEEAGLIGSSAYRKKHRKESSGQIILNLDCVGEGNEIILFPTAKLKKKRTEMDRFASLCRNHDGKSVSLVPDGFAIYPSDQTNFPLGFGIASFRHSRWAGLYLGKIHTKRDTSLDEKNVAMIRDFLMEVVRNQA